MQTCNKDRLIQNLRDCDCDEAVINAFMEKLERGEKGAALALLAQHRRDLLEQFHRCDSYIGCLDYLTAQLEREEALI